MSLLSQFLAFAVTLATLILLGRWVTRHVQTIGWLLTGNASVTMIAYYLVMFPGILLHEVSHYATARILGIKVTDFSLGPRRRKNSKTVELGSVSVYSGGTIPDSLIGVAPFVAGTAVLLLVSYMVFDVGALGRVWVAQGWSGFFATVAALPKTPDFWLWLYVIFTVSNAMMPSASDRRPWLLAGIYVAGVLLVAWVVGLFSFLSDEVWENLLGALQVLTLAFLFTVFVNVVIGSVLWVIATILLRLSKSPQ
ncbi:MAG: hypothetical protein ACM30E_10130 [Nitrososphaerales archaeon]